MEFGSGGDQEVVELFNRHSLDLISLSSITEFVFVALLQTSMHKHLNKNGAKVLHSVAVLPGSLCPLFLCLCELCGSGLLLSSLPSLLQHIITVCGPQLFSRFLSDMWCFSLSHYLQGSTVYFQQATADKGEIKVKQSCQNTF